MAKGLRASVKKTNRTRLRATVFGPVEDARTERISQKLLELAQQPRPEKTDMDVDTDKTSSKECDRQEGGESSSPAQSPCTQNTGFPVNEKDQRPLATPKPIDYRFDSGYNSEDTDDSNHHIQPAFTACHLNLDRLNDCLTDNFDNMPWDMLGLLLHADSGFGDAEKDISLSEDDL